MRSLRASRNSIPPERANQVGESLLAHFTLVGNLRIPIAHCARHRESAAEKMYSRDELDHAHQDPIQ